MFRSFIVLWVLLILVAPVVPALVSHLATMPLHVEAKAIVPLRPTGDGTAGITDYTNPHATGSQALSPAFSYTKQELCIVSSTLRSGANPCPDNLSPLGIAFDPANGNIYVTDGSSNSVDVVSTTTGSVTGSISVGTSPLWITYDGTNGDLYVTNHGSNNVSVISGATGKVVGSVNVGTSPQGVAFDPTNGDIYVANAASSTVSVIADTNNSVLYTIHVGRSPMGMAFDSTNGDVYSVNEGSFNVTVISGSTNKVVANVPAGLSPNSWPIDAVFDSGNGDIYVSTSENDVDVIAGANNTRLGNITIGGSSALGRMAFDSTNGDVYVPDLGIYNVSVISGSVNKVVANITAGGKLSGLPFSWPVAVSFGSTTGNLYVVMDTAFNGLKSGSLMVVSDATNKAVASVLLGAQPYGGGLDPVNGNIYVTDYNCNTVNAIAASSNRVVGTVTVGKAPFGTATDSANGYVYVSNWYSNTVSVIAGSNNSVVATVAVGSSPGAITFDPANGDIYVANNASNTVSVLNGSNHTVVATIPTGTAPGAGGGLSFDPLNGDVYVGNWASNSLSVISGATNKVVATIPVANHPWGSAFDTVNGDLYVSIGDLGNVAVLATSTNRVIANISVYGGPVEGAFDSSNGDIYFSDEWGNNVTVINGSMNKVIANISVGNGPYGVVYAPSNRNVYVMNYQSSSVSIIEPAASNPKYNVTFSQTGLPAGTSWSVTLGVATNSSTTKMITFTESNGTYNYTVGAVAGYTANPQSGSEKVNGTAVSAAIAFTPKASPTYAVTFTESGLPSGTTWSVALNGATNSSTTKTINFKEPNGNYSFVVGAVAGYSANLSSGTLQVSGNPVSRSVVFTYTPSQYAVKFNESGLPAGTNWSVTLGGLQHSSASSTITFNEPNGTYSYTVGVVSGYVASPPSGNVTVNGRLTTVSITFASSGVGKFAITFTESGLPSGTSWSVILAGSSLSSTGPTITFHEMNGTYSFTVGTVSGYTAAPSSGSLTVSGAAVSKTLTFTTIPNGHYAVEFNETGLPVGTSWSVTLYNIRYYSNGSTILLTEPNGTFAYSVGAVAGYTANPSSGSITVNGKGVTVSVSFGRISAAPPGFMGLSGNLWYIVVIGLVVAAAVAALLLVRGRSKRAGATNTDVTNSVVEPSGQRPPGIIKQ